MPIGRAVTIRYVQPHGLICGFECEVAHLMVKPYSLLFLSYPESIEILSLRRHDRVSCYLPATIFLGEEECKGVILNISSGGCKALIESCESGGVAALAKDVELFFQVKLFNADEETYIRGLVKSFISEGKRSAVAGVAFDELSEDVQESIDGYVASVRDYLLE